MNNLSCRSVTTERDSNSVNFCLPKKILNTHPWVLMHHKNILILCFIAHGYKLPATNCRGPLDLSMELSTDVSESANFPKDGNSKLFRY